MRPSFVIPALAGLALWLAGAGARVDAAPAAKLWPRWQAHDADSTKQIDHQAFDVFLSRYVVVHAHGPNAVAYGDVAPADAKALNAYIDHLEALPIDDYNRNVQRAYWINLYNAETLSLVIAHWPVDSIRDIDGGLLNTGPWDEKRLEVEHQRLSLNDIEHRILRPIWGDGLTHYGVNCASVSCPSLIDHAYTGADVHEQLMANARAYINSPQGVSLDHGKLIVSKIYDWYGADFGSPTGVLKHLRHYAAPPLATRLSRYHAIDGYRYDWRVNSPDNVDSVLP